MCGIMGLCGKGEIGKGLITGLKRLEYRGYDSAGLALWQPEGFFVRKRTGRVAQLEGVSLPPAQMGIAHTRWATHGAPTQANCHPHCSWDGRVVGVHNGTVTNEGELRARLQAQGVRFVGETDSEVAIDLIASYYEADLLAAVRKAAKQLKGALAIAVMGTQTPDHIVVYAKDSPVVVGRGSAGGALASDPAALVGFADEYVRVPGGGFATVGAGAVRLFDAEGAPLTPVWQALQPAQGESPEGSRMAAEIAWVPRALADTLAHYRACPQPLLQVAERVRRAPAVRLIACGTAYHACLSGAWFMRSVLNGEWRTEVASCFRDAPGVVQPDEVALFVSQSGETADTLAAMRLAEQKGAFTVAITNTPHSQLADSARAVLPTLCGAERAVASTKAYNAQVLVLFLLALAVAGELEGAWEELEGVVGRCAAITPAPAREAAHRFASCPLYFFLGRGQDASIAREGALKLKEISYLPCFAYPAGELKHGTLALVEQGVCAVVVATDPALSEKTALAVAEVRARGAQVLLLAPPSIARTLPHDALLPLPEGNARYAPLYAMVPLQYYAYFCACLLGRDADHPRNLAKSVTVE